MIGPVRMRTHSLLEIVGVTCFSGEIEEAFLKFNAASQLRNGHKPAKLERAHAEWNLYLT